MTATVTDPNTGEQVALPVPVREFVREWDGKASRTRKFVFYFADSAQEGEQEVVEVSAYHDKDRKRYAASAHRVTRSNEHGFSVTKFEMFAPNTRVTLLTEPVQRFSQANLETFAQKALTQFHQHVEQGTEQVLSLFAAKEGVAA